MATAKEEFVLEVVQNHTSLLRVLAALRNNLKEARDRGFDKSLTDADVAGLADRLEPPKVAEIQAALTCVQELDAWLNQIIDVKAGDTRYSRFWTLFRRRV